jgi:hypothetical protein
MAAGPSGFSFVTFRPGLGLATGAGPVGFSPVSFQPEVGFVASANAQAIAQNVARAHMADARPVNIITQENLETAAAAMMALPQDGKRRTPQELTANAGGAIQNAARKHGSVHGYRMASAEGEGFLTAWHPLDEMRAYQKMISECCAGKCYRYDAGRTGQFVIERGDFPAGHGVVLRRVRGAGSDKEYRWVIGESFHFIEVFGENDEFARAFTRDGRVLIFSTGTGTFVREEQVSASALLLENHWVVGVAMMRDDDRWNFFRLEGSPVNFIEVDRADGRSWYFLRGSSEIVELVKLREKGRRVPSPQPRSAKGWGPVLAQEFLTDIGARALMYEIGVTGAFCLKGTGPNGGKVLVRKKGSKPVLDRVFRDLRLVGPKDELAVGKTIEGEQGVFSIETGQMVLAGEYDIETGADGSTKLVKKREEE